MKLILCLFLTLSLSAKTIEIFSYNVENLFDTKHDEGKEDWTFLPKNTKGKEDACKKIASSYRRKECYEIDWNEKKLALKLQNIKRVLTENRSTLADIVGLIEIENENVVRQLADLVGYKKIAVANSPDERGIDVALMFNESADLKFVKQSEIILKDGYFAKRATRNILEVEFEIAKKNKLHVFVNHWPSLSNPDEARELAAKALRSRVEEILKANKEANIIALGDFNTIDKLKTSSSVHPFNGILLKNDLMTDVGEKFRQMKKDANMPPGTYYYDRGGEWNQLDRFFVNSNLMDAKNLSAEIDSFQIYAPEFIKNMSFLRNREDDKSMPSPKEMLEKSIPKRYDHAKEKIEEVGFSDHFPIIIKLRY